MITAVNNNQVKKAIQLNQKAKVRREEKLFVAEGCKMFLEAPDKKIRNVYVTESFYHKNEACREKLSKCGYELVSEEVLKRMSDTQTPQGILCVMEQSAYEITDLLTKENPLLLVLEDLQDPGNLGTIVRTGEGAGIDGLIMSRNTVDIYNPKTIRGTMGSIYRVPFVYAENMDEVLTLLKKRGITTYAAHLSGSRCYNSFSYEKGTAFLIGNEGNGLKEETAKKADCYVKIPMKGQVESLNAAVAAALLMYGAMTQRS